MTTQEFSDSFDTLLNSYNTQAQFGNQTSIRDIALDEYEKSLYLTKAQEEVVVNLYNGKNPYNDSFENTEELRRYLDSLVRTKTYTEEDKYDSIGVSPDSTFYKLPDDLAFIIMEQIIFSDEELGCYNNSIAGVYPVTHDEYSKVRNNPFRGATKYKAIRLDSGDNIVEIISKYKIGEYLLRYLSKPTPIILETLPNNLTIDGVSEQTECALNPILHNTILNRAVLMAIQSKGISTTK